MGVYQELHERGFIYQETDAEAGQYLLEHEKVAFYTGFDPTGASLHVGHLLPIMAMRLLQRCGHIPIVLVGGATALVGDPSGKQSVRPILTREEVAANAASLRQQLSRFFSMKEGEGHFVNNLDWFKDISYLDFLREVGTKFSINRMLAQDSVKSRLETGLTFLEFNYSILQAYDFQILNRKLNCRLQLGGQDQWGNMVAGVELVRRTNQQEVYGITVPLLLDSNGQKFGKTAGGNNVWLDAARTSFFDYYQFWRNCEDSEVVKLLCFFTDLPVDEIQQLGALEAPAINRAKEILAYEATCLAHGKAEAEKAFLAAGSKFGFAEPDIGFDVSSEITAITADSLRGGDHLPTVSLSGSAFADDGCWSVKLFTDAGLCKSNGEARRLIQGGGAYINDQRVTGVDINVTLSEFKDNHIILRAGKKNIVRVALSS